MKKVLGSVHKTSLGDTVVVLDGERSCMQSKASEHKARIKYEDGPCIMCMWGPVGRSEKKEESENACNPLAVLAAESEEVFSRHVRSP